MRVKTVIDEDFINYKKPSFFIAFPDCTFKCDHDCGRQVCQNSALVNEPDIEVSFYSLVRRYMDNPLTSAIVLGGLEPLHSPQILIELVQSFRDVTDDDIVIYTGFNKKEVVDIILQLAAYKNIIIKFGRFVPDQQPHYDAVLGVKLASDNQYAERIS